MENINGGILKSSELKALKEKSATIVASLPGTITTDGTGHFYDIESVGEVDHAELIGMLNGTVKAVQELDAVIQDIKDRKSPTKEGEGQ